jgi:hypothetical protein
VPAHPIVVAHLNFTTLHYGKRANSGFLKAMPSLLPYLFIRAGLRDEASLAGQYTKALTGEEHMVNELQGVHFWGIAVMLFSPVPQ